MANYNRKQYSDAEKAEYWRKRALNGGSDSGRSYSRNSRSSSYSGAPKKRSGAKFTRYKNDGGTERYLTTGWKLSKTKELITFKCVTTDKSADAGKGWLGSIACSVLNKSNMQKSFYWGCMEAKTGKVVIQELGLVLNPKVKNGGYCGTFIQK
ncbi:hypothetical protein [Chryseobacterium defluvii]|uniref:Uncharacterized protein n=1 Tax=Chryseobacterium defluvii TaxID=160396 RepID=A0A495SDC4_9FLAO|nr:hypothetical protein [Chryseobacterium defluvii]RKS98238.1 hypothetical protein BCF58_2379 [Chryseobacterium defluvii]